MDGNVGTKRSRSPTHAEPGVRGNDVLAPEANSKTKPAQTAEEKKARKEFRKAKRRENDERAAPNPGPQAGAGAARPLPLSSSEIMRLSAQAASPAAVPNQKVGRHEMYQRFPGAYDVLMSRHDCVALEQRLIDLLRGVAAGRQIVAADVGAGTGRIARMLAKVQFVRAVYASDKAAPMLRQLAANVLCECAAIDRPVEFVDSFPALAPAAAEADDGTGRFTVVMRSASFADIAEGTEQTVFAGARCSSIICAWSLNYVQLAQWGGGRWHGEMDRTLRAMVSSLDTTAGDAALIVIETLGNGTEVPNRGSTYTAFLEERWGMHAEWLRTDYKFESVDEGRRLCTFFFGAQIAEAYASRGSATLPECTGIWVLRIPQGTDVSRVGPRPQEETTVGDGPTAAAQ